jgi:hypothetical protein
MKLIFTLSFYFLTLTVLGQATNRDVVLSFWNSNVQSILNFDKAKIIEETNFPLEGSWGYTIELESGPDKWTKDDFVNNIDKIFTEELRTNLKGKTYNDLVHYKDETGTLIFIINLSFLTKDEASGETFESSTILFFKMFDNHWKLYSIEYAG